MRQRGPEPWPDIVWRRPLTAAEEAALRPSLAADPAGRQLLEEEEQLSRLLAELPNAPVPSHFTALVLATLDRETTATRRPRWWSWNAAAWFLSPRWAVATGLVLLLSAGVWRQHTVSRAQMAASLASIAGPVLVASKAVEMPPVEILRDFEAINHLRQLTTQPDLELLLCLQGETGLP